MRAKWNCGTKVQGIVIAVAIVLGTPALVRAQNNNCRQNPNAPGCKESSPPPRPQPEERPAPPPREERPAPEPERPAPEPQRPTYTPPPQPERPSNNGGGGNNGNNGGNNGGYRPPANNGGNNGGGYAPPANNNGGNSGGYRLPSQPPATTYTPRTYTPGANNSGGNGSPNGGANGGGATVYTPRTYTPGATNDTPNRTAGNGGATTNNGVTTYTPQPRTSNPPAGNGVTVYTPGATNTGGRTTGNGGVAASNGGTVRAGNAVRPPLRPAYTVPATAVASRGAAGVQLNPAGSAAVLHDVNAARTNLAGINKRPLPTGQITQQGNGSLIIRTGSGGSLLVRPNGTLGAFTRGNENARFLGNGQIRSMHTATMDVSRAPRGVQTVALRQGNNLVVSTGGRTGYVQKSVVIGGKPMIERTSLAGGAPVVQVYSPYTLHGVVLDHYMPAYYYDPDFYGWAFYPWAAPAAFAWGWGGDPWYAYDAGYFAPWPTYRSGAYWLTDYYLSQTLAESYAEQIVDALRGNQPAEADADADPYASDEQDAPDDEEYAQRDTPLSPDVKQAIADEVQQQLSYENAAAQQPAQGPDLSDLPEVLVAGHVFVADQPLNVVTTDSQQCVLSGGDALRLVAKPDDSSAAADLIVVSTRAGDCPADVVVSISLVDLEEMQNNFRQRIDAGLQQLHQMQGQDGLPAAPAVAMSNAPRPVEAMPPADPNAAAELQSAQQQANQAETQVTDAAFAGGAPGPAASKPEPF